MYLSSRLAIFAAFVLLWVFPGRQAMAQDYLETALYYFCSQGGAACTDGVSAESGLIQAADGQFYGTTTEGGEALPYGGTLFKITPSGTLTTIYSFCSQIDNGICSDGLGPQAGLIQGGDGNFYGTTYEGGFNKSGSDDYGTVFKITPSGELSTLYSFCREGGSNCTDGAAPVANLVQGSDGNFYGTTALTIFKITPSGNLTTLYNFCSQSGCADGTSPFAGLVQGTDGNFYGTTRYGGANSAYCTFPSNTCGTGTIFKITPSGAFSTLYTFCLQGGPNSEGGTTCLDGSNPADALVAGGDGNFYGTTTLGGSYTSVCNYHGCGTAFKITSEGFLTTLNSFSVFCDQGDTCAGGQPSGLMQGTDGNFYGSTDVFFSLTPAGVLSTLDAGPLNLVLQGNDGNFYTTSYGEVIRVAVIPALPAPVQLSISPSQAAPGKAVTVSLQVLNAFSLTMQQCYAFATGNGITTPLGKVLGAYNSSTKLYTYSGKLTPIQPGVYNLAVTCGGIESGLATLTVGGTTATTLISTPTAPSVGQSITLTANVTTGSGTPTGTVNFIFDGLSLGSANLVGGVTSLTISTTALPAGSYAITAEYGGSSGDLPSTSAAATITLKKASTTTTLAATTTPSAVSLVATVVRPMGYAGAPTGTVSFYYQSVLLGTASVNASGVATLSYRTTGIAAGNYPVTASYSGDAGDTTSSSGVIVAVD